MAKGQTSSDRIYKKVATHALIKRLTPLSVDKHRQANTPKKETLNMEKIIIDGVEFIGYRIATENAALLMIKAPHGFLGCGYFNIDIANRLNEHVAIVSGVKNFDDMLKAKVIATSNAAEKNEIKLGISGREALLLMING